MVEMNRRTDERIIRNIGSGKGYGDEPDTGVRGCWAGTCCRDLEMDISMFGSQCKESLLSSSRDPEIGTSTSPSFLTTKVDIWLLLRWSVGNDSSQYGRVEGAVSGCRPAGPQNVGQVVSVCLVCAR